MDKEERWIKIQIYEEKLWEYWEKNYIIDFKEYCHFIGVNSLAMSMVEIRTKITKIGKQKVQEKSEKKHGKWVEIGQTLIKIGEELGMKISVEKKNNTQRRRNRMSSRALQGQR